MKYYLVIEGFYPATYGYVNLNTAHKNLRMSGHRLYTLELYIIPPKVLYHTN